MRGTIFDIKEMAMHDGPGIRTTVFFKGCPLRCKWCHNPEGLTKLPQLSFKEALCVGCGSCKKVCDHEECKKHARCIRSCPHGLLKIVGEEIDSDELKKRLLPSAITLGDAFGGFTFSGGEPLMQSDFLIELASQLSDYHLAIETSGYAESGVFEAVIKKMDLVIMDIKLADPDAHKFYTGTDNAQILENLKLLQKSARPHLIRTPLIPGITDTAENLRAIKALVADSPWEKLPYNSLAGAKYPELGMKYEL